MPKPLPTPSHRLAATAWLAVAWLAAGCSGTGSARPIEARGEAPAAGAQLFTRMPSSYTGVTFENRVVDTEKQNVFTYRNRYNGGGVAVGDLNGDGLPEIVLTSNEGGARLYLNGGKFRFRDVSDAAGIHARKNSWTTGVTLVDLNGDGRLDIYVSHAGAGTPADRANELYINDGAGADSVPRFTERAAEMGLADGGYSTQAVALDYDGDGDLDLFLARNSPKPVTSFGTRNTRNVRDPFGGAKLYRNDGGHFTDVSEKAGIFSPENAFGLGVVAADVNRDGWPDIYVSSDYYERDYLYLNRGDGTFAEVLDKEMPYLSYFSMGLDVADVDNDGLPDVYTTDMLPEDETRLKTTTAFEGWDVYQAKVHTGYHRQLMRNMLQHNNGDGTFSDVGQMAGVARTDWSWSALAVDLDLDGAKDIFVTNGVVKDVTSQDYVAYLANDSTMASVTKGGRVDFMKLVAAMQSTPIANYAFHNDGGLAFTNRSAAWGLDTPSLSNGAAYGDLDGDGTPDLVVNNANQEAFVYRNNARTLLPANHSLQVRLEGEGANRLAVGAKVTLRVGDRQLYQELEPTRGFESSSDYLLTFGLGPAATVDSVTVEWPDGRVSVVRQVKADQRITVKHAGSATVAGVPRGRVAMAEAPAATTSGTMLTDVTAAVGLDFVHHEDDFVDFDRERLIPKMLSTEGPMVAVADVNGDGLDDMYIGGAKDQPGALLVQTSDGHFTHTSDLTFDVGAISEDVGATFFDANGDGRPDLYVVSGGSEFSENAPALQDRLYINDGRGRFHMAVDALPAEHETGSRVVAADYDGDGDMDLFVGGRVVPWQYGVSPRSMLLRNDGSGHFTDVTATLAPELERVGLVTDAAWRDVDGDGRPDLTVVGEWMPITVFHNAGGGRLARAAVRGLDRTEGWWNRILAGDFTGHGRTDFLVGNLGLNTRLQATDSTPVMMYVKDFDRNGYTEEILTSYNGGTSYPITLRDDLIKALPYLKARYPSYKAYAKQTITDIFTPKELEGAVVRQARTFATALARNDGHGGFTMIPLPREAQVAPVYGMLAQDIDGDGHTDLLLAGNFEGVKPELGTMTAGRGLLLRGDGQGGFTPVPATRSGFSIPGQVRDIQRVRTRDGVLIVVARNNDRPLLFRPAPRDTHREGAPRAIASRNR